eukprot:gnl/Hemi2/3085_TR1090_c0_g1_i1.p1 gnl/Hemi2/3085_TR1090_c0_g1~~gnl/Hemi2/3085_TR1090_c0_g1_i1.p1  ORF type:complete len:641 (+),score=176.65 gnl/Hemi2/3085_TR1090_c0_g1_i1:145-2067(+)
MEQPAKNPLLTADKVNALKSLVHDHLRSKDVYSEIRRFLAGYVSSGRADTQLREQNVIEALNERGVIQDIIRSLGRPTELAQALQPKIPSSGDAPPTPAGNRRYLYLRVLGGKSFVDHLQERDPNLRTLTLHVHYKNQRLQSKPVACAVEPAFEDAFMIDLQPDVAIPVDLKTLLQDTCPIHLVVSQADAEGVRIILGTHSLEWRHVLMTGKLSVMVELLGAGQSIVGLLELRVDLCPTPNESYTADEIQVQVKNDRLRSIEAERFFLNYARSWWNEYLQVRELHKNRLVKIFGTSETGVNRCVCTFVRPLSAGRLLDSPAQAARFVSLLPYEKEEVVGGGRKEIFNTTHTFLCKGRGDCEDHAILLCGLLLGFSLDAYVCVGLAQLNNRSLAEDFLWVMTRSNTGDNKVTFWDPLSGLRYEHNKAVTVQPRHKFKNIYCIFNHKTFVANNQPDDAILGCSFDLENDTQWKAMRPDHIATLTPVVEVPLRAPTFSIFTLEESLEASLQDLISTYRRELRPLQQLTTNWDAQLSYLLTPAIASYEMERVHGTPTGTQEFQQSIKRAVPDGHTFKGFPIQFSHHNPQRMFSALLNSPTGAELLRTSGDYVRFGLRVKIYAYPEEAKAVWVMVAVKYRSVMAP